MTELKPCPFCGSKPEILCTSTSANSNAVNAFARFFKIWCPKCGCKLGDRPIPVTFDYLPHIGPRADETELNKAIERWNRRAEDG